MENKLKSMKTFESHFNMFRDKIKSHENFAYSRFSDGELRIMQNLETEIGPGFYTKGNLKGSCAYPVEDYKRWNPDTDQFYREKLMEAYTYQKPEYYVGLSCRCCVGDNDFNQMKSWFLGDPESKNLTWANIFLNGNYPRFMNEIVPLFKEWNVVYIVNENADLTNLPFKVVKDFRIGPNCIINDYHQIEDIKQWISENNIEDHLFLFSASTLSNYMIHQLYEFSDKNTYIDIGTTLNPLIGMKGRRGYHNGNNKICIW